MENIGKAFDAADSGDWAGFVMVMGGPFVKRSNLTIQLAKLSATDQLTGEIRLNQYMEPASDQVYGIEENGLTICTRFHEWRIQTILIDQSVGHEPGQPDLVNLSDLTYSLGDGHDNTPLEEVLTYRLKPVRNVTGSEWVSDTNIPIGSGTVPESSEKSSETNRRLRINVPELSKENAGTSSGPLEFCQ